MNKKAEMIVLAPSGAKQTSRALPLSGDVKPHLIRKAYLAYLVGLRRPTAKTKTRGEVRGGGKKPWRQKGTGRARVGSTRNPIWRGGGVVFGPTGSENYTKKLPTKELKAALKGALLLKAHDGKLYLLEKLGAQKTKEAAQILKPLGAHRVLILTAAKDEAAKRVLRNIEGVRINAINGMNVVEVVDADAVVLLGGADKALADYFESKRPQVEPAEEREMAVTEKSEKAAVKEEVAA